MIMDSAATSTRNANSGLFDSEACALNFMMLHIAINLFLRLMTSLMNFELFKTRNSLLLVLCSEQVAQNQTHSQH